MGALFVAHENKMRMILVVGCALFAGCGGSYAQVVAPYSKDYEKVRQKLGRIAGQLNAEPPVAGAVVLKTPSPLPTFTLLPELSNVSIVDFDDLSESRPYEESQRWPHFGSYAHNDLLEGLDYVENIAGWRKANFHEAMAEDMREACQRGLLTKYLLVIRPDGLTPIEKSADGFTGGTGRFDVFLVEMQGEEVIAKLSIAADTSGLQEKHLPRSNSEKDWKEFVRTVHWRIESNAQELLTVELNNLLGTELELWAR